MVTKENSILVRVRSSMMSFSKADKDVSEEVKKNHQLGENAGTYIKTIVPRKTMKKLTTAFGEVDKVRLRYTLPWADGNIRVLSAKAFKTFSQELQKKIYNVDEEVREFLDHYDEIKEETKRRLNGLYKEEDFPTKSQIRQSFGIRVSYFPIPDNRDFRIGVEEVKSSFDQDMEDQIKSAQREIWRRFKEVLGSFYERLSKEDSRFKQATVAKISDLVDLVKVLNMDDDANIEEFRQEVEEKLTGFDTKDLREDQDFRTQKVEAAKELLKKLDSYL
jgi:gas vesicle protein